MILRKEAEMDPAAQAELRRRNFAKHRTWGETFVPEAMSIIEQNVLLRARVKCRVAPPDDDMRRNTDLFAVTITPEDTRVGLRFRRIEHFAKYGGQFTVRSHVPGADKTEMHKIMDGWGRYIFYAFCLPEERIAYWTVANLDIFREWAGRHLAATGKWPGTPITNDDGTQFIPYRWGELPTGFVVNSNIPTQTLLF